MRRNWILIIIVLIIIVALAVYLFYQPPAQMNTVTFSLNGVEDVSPAHLEGWAIFGEEKVSTGKFDVGDSLEFTIDRNLSEADMFVITIEPEGDTDTEPSGIIYLSGSLVDDSANLEFPVDFTDVTGTYILATPTNGPDTNENSGIWFIQRQALFLQPLDPFGRD